MLAGILGFVLHRSGLCMVRTVAEIFSSRRVNMLAGILTTALWVFTVFLVWTFLLGDRNPFNENYALTYLALVGGAFMGGGTVLIPGGKDTLILKSIPVLSFHAIPTFAALLCDIAIMLYAKRYV